MAPCELSIVIVSWNSADRLGSCIDALRTSAASAESEVEIVVIENGSSRRSADIARGLRADRVIVNPLNAGFGVAASQGLTLARGEWLMLANPDLVVDQGFVSAILQAARSVHKDVGALVPDIRFDVDSSIVECRGVEVDVTGVPAGIGAGRPASEAPEPVRVFGGSSGGCVFRAEALHHVGGLEPAFFAYLEDIDLAWRMNRAGYRALFIPEALAYHEGSVSLGEGSWLKSYLVARNRRILFRLNGPHTLRARAWRALTELGHALVVSRSGAGSAPWRGRMAALRSRKYVRFVCRSRSLVDTVAEPVLSPRFGFREALARKRSVEKQMQRGSAAAASRSRGSS